MTDQSAARTEPVSDRAGSSRRAVRFAALVRKETFQVIRDPSSILIAFVMPVILLFIFGFGVSLDANSTRIGLVIEEPTPVTLDLAASFEASLFFEVVNGRDRRELESALISGDVGGIVVISNLFARDFARGGAPAIQVIVDGSDPNTASFVQNYAQGIVASWGRIRAGEVSGQQGAISVEDRFWFNPELTSRYFLVPGSIAIVMTLVGTLLTSLVVAREWERGTMEAIMATPVTSAELLLGKILPYFVLGIVSVTICLILAIFVFSVPFRGSLLAFYALSACFLMPALGQGLLISAATRNQFLASQVALVTGFLPSFLLSGFLFEIESMPQPIQWITFVVSARYLIPALQTVFLAGDIWPLLLSNMGIMIFIGSVFFILAARNMKKRIA